MKAFKVQVAITTIKDVIVEAATQSEAYDTVKEAYENGYFDIDWCDDKVSYSVNRASMELPEVCPKCGRKHSECDPHQYIGIEGRCLECGKLLI